MAVRANRGGQDSTQGTGKFANNLAPGYNNFFGNAYNTADVLGSRNDVNFGVHTAMTGTYAFNSTFSNWFSRAATPAPAASTYVLIGDPTSSVVQPTALNAGTYKETAQFKIGSAASPSMAGPDSGFLDYNGQPRSQWTYFMMSGTTMAYGSVTNLNPITVGSRGSLSPIHPFYPTGPSGPPAPCTGVNDCDAVDQTAALGYGPAVVPYTNLDITTYTYGWITATVTDGVNPLPNICVMIQPTSTSTFQFEPFEKITQADGTFGNNSSLPPIQGIPIPATGDVLLTFNSGACYMHNPKWLTDTETATLPWNPATPGLPKVNLGIIALGLQPVSSPPTSGNGTIGGKVTAFEGGGLLQNMTVHAISSQGWEVKSALTNSTLDANGNNYVLDHLDTGAGVTYTVSAVLGRGEGTRVPVGGSRKVNLPDATPVYSQNFTASGVHGTVKGAAAKGTIIIASSSAINWANPPKITADAGLNWYTTVAKSDGTYSLSVAPLTAGAYNVYCLKSDGTVGSPANSTGAVAPQATVTGIDCP